jgi:signal transduction histidine kinase
MFHSVGRRLALLNAVMVIAIIALVGLGTAALLRTELNREETRLLQRRAESAAQAWANQFDGASSSRARSSLESSLADQEDDDEDDEEDDDEDREERDALTGGDVVLYGVNRDGELIVNDRGFTYSGLPDQAAIAVALTGEDDEREVTVNGEAVRLYTVPVINDDGEITGAVQAARGQSLYEQQRSTVLWASVAGIVVGVILAPLAGLFLARRAMRPIDAAFSAQRAFVADASHELRTPLTVLRANAELLTRMPDATPDEIETEAGQMIGTIDDMTRLVNDLLFLARVDEDVPGVLEHQLVDLASIVREEAALHQSRAAEAGLTLTVDAATGPVMTGDAARLRQVVRILIDNALAYTPAGGSIRIALAGTPREAVLSVRDTGIGIPHADQARVFERFYRADPARARQTGGAGLGLAIARTIVEGHGGTITLASEPGAGSLFTIRLPLHLPGSSTGGGD